MALSANQSFSHFQDHTHMKIAKRLVHVYGDTDTNIDLIHSLSMSSLNKTQLLFLRTFINYRYRQFKVTHSTIWPMSLRRVNLSNPTFVDSQLATIWQRLNGK